MVTLDDVVRSTVESFIRDSVLFTALDVSNKVKDDMPFARHREVRDLVRSLFVTDIEPAGYAKTPIQVTLNDGSSVEALLYHPLVDSWDLDSKYDAQKRAQTAAKPAAVSARDLAAQAAGISVTPVPGLPVLPSAHPMPKVVSNPVASPAPIATPTPAPARALWDQMFQSQPSLFPRR